MSSSWEDEIIITVKVVPGSSRTEFAGCQGDLYRVKVAAAPEKGKANKVLVDYLARTFNIRKNDIQIQNGLTSRIKQILLRGVSGEDIQSQFTKQQ